MRLVTPLLCVVAFLAAPASAEEGELHPDTKGRLEQRITIELRGIPMAELIKILAERTGLSFVASVDVAHMPEPMMLVANNITVGELLHAAAFALHLEMQITPEGIVSFRFSREDPRRESSLRRYEEMHERRREAERARGRGRGERPELPQEEAVEIARRHPRIAEAIEEWGAFLRPREFVAEKGVWLIDLRKTEDGPPVGVVVVRPGGEVNVKMHDFGHEGEWPAQRKKKMKDKRRDEGKEGERKRFEFRDRPRDEELERF